MQAVICKAAGLNFPDTLMVAGKYQVKPPFPFSPGMECAGVVTEVGADVTAVRKGDRVTSMPGHGGMAEVSSRARRLARWPGIQFHSRRIGPRSIAAIAAPGATTISSSARGDDDFEQPGATTISSSARGDALSAAGRPGAGCRCSCPAGSARGR